MLKKQFVFLLLFLMGLSILAGSTWEEAKQKKVAELDLYWFTSRPFIYRESDGRLAGIEYEIMKSFADFVRGKYDVNIQLKWTEAESFNAIINIISDASGRQSSIGVSAFSITDERQRIMRFSKPYFPDITVLVSSQGTEIVDTYEEIHDMMSVMTAVTIKGTNYENLLLDLQENLNEDFKIHYIESDQNILDNIAKAPDRFGFIDLPIYLMLVTRGGELVRQNFFTVKGTGYGFAMPINSDWKVVFDEFLMSQTADNQIAEIISKYLGNELYQFIQQAEDDDQVGVSILTKEKELQLELIRNANLKLEEEQAFKKILILGISITGLFLVVIGVLFFNNSRKTRMLIQQKGQIERQQVDINKKNDQLSNRNKQLVSIMEEKNHLVRVLAHDLRSPLQQVVGFVDLMLKSATKRSEEDQTNLHFISEASQRMKTMINRILQEAIVESDKNFVLKELVNPIEIMTEIKNRFELDARKKDIGLVLTAPQSELELFSDRLLLQLVIENLVSNAIKFSPFHSQVTLACEQHDSEIILRVADEGPGFTDEDKLLIFNRFQRLSAKPTADESSTGLGLSIVKKYVDDLGGRISLTSNVSKGSVFDVTLPRA